MTRRGVVTGALVSFQLLLLFCIELLTLRKLYNYPEEASARSHRLHHLERSRSVVVRLLVVNLLFMSAPQLLRQKRAAVAAKLNKEGVVGIKIMA